MTKWEQIQASIERNYSACSNIEKRRIMRQNFARWLTRGRTIGSKINPKTGKREYTIEGPNIALLI